MTLRDEQVAREESSVTRGVERVMSQVRKDREKRREFDNGPGFVMVTHLVQSAVENVKRLQRTSADRTRRAMARNAKGVRLHDHDIPATCLPADVLAFITIKTMLNTSSSGWSDVKVGQIVGDLAETEFKWGQMRKAESSRPKDGEGVGYNRLTYLKRETKNLNPRSVKKWLKRLSDLEVEGWAREDRVRLGLNLVDCILEACPDVFERTLQTETKGGKLHKRNVITIKEEARKKLDAEIKRLAWNSPWMVPMICRPDDWTADSLGGYLTGPLKVDAVKPMNGKAYGGDIPAVVLDALNAVQSTPWVINARLLQVAQAAHEMAQDAPQDALIHKILPVQVWLEQLPQVPDEEWVTMAPEEKAKVRTRRKEIYDDNFSLQSKREVVSRQMAVAQDFKDHDEIYFPHNLDFRGRMYPLPQDLHPQADDFGKSLLLFARAKPLGQSGFEWLCFTLASAFGNGQDKATRDEQLEWCYANQDAVCALADSPLDNQEFWAQADEPWQFLAAAEEFANALEFGLGYACPLPIHVDGSCNGLQHLSAMGKDPVGAKAVNLLPGERQDIYQIVADKVDASVEADNAWHGKVTRKVVKRGVMTKPYGLTHVGARDQLIRDRKKNWPTVEGDWRDNATYMRDKMMEAIKDTVHASVVIMDWMQECSRALANAKVATRWTAPTGFEVTQEYCKGRRRYYSVIGVMFRAERQVKLNEITDEIWVAKQVQSVAPNIVHSFDAAHMQMVVAQAAGTGLTDSISAVHDSFGCHACDMDAFLDIIKVEFIRIYTTDVLADLYHEFVAQAPDGVVIPEPPAVGDFDVQDVAASDFFFA